MTSSERTRCILPSMSLMNCLTFGMMAEYNGLTGSPGIIAWRPGYFLKSLANSLNTISLGYGCTLLARVVSMYLCTAEPLAREMRLFRFHCRSNSSGFTFCFLADFSTTFFSMNGGATEPVTLVTDTVFCPFMV